MSTLVDWRIRQLAQHSKAIQPFREEQLNPASYNLTIGGKGFVESPVIGPHRTKSGLTPVDLTHGFILPPGGWILTDVEEFVRIPPNMEAQVILRSSAARKGWDHALAGYVDPSYQGRLTLEFVNCLKHHSLEIRKGMQMVQLKISRLDEMPQEGYDKTGRYFGDTEVQGNRDLSI